MKTMRVAQVPKAKANIEIVERPIPDPGPDTLRIKVAACGVCHSDVLVKEGLWPGIQYPRVPGHEVSGVVPRGCSPKLPVFGGADDGYSRVAGKFSTLRVSACKTKQKRNGPVS